MVKKNALLFVALGVSSNCFGMNPKKNNNQSFFSVATMQILKFFFNPNKPKQLPAPTPINKEFVCKEKGDENQAEREIREALKKTAKNISAWELEEEQRINNEIKTEFERLKQQRYSKKG